MFENISCMFENISRMFEIFPHMHENISRMMKIYLRKIKIKAAPSYPEAAKKNWRRPIVKRTTPMLKN
jgi:hypothetical protein